MGEGVSEAKHFKEKYYAKPGLGGIFFWGGGGGRVNKRKNSLGRLGMDIIIRTKQHILNNLLKVYCLLPHGNKRNSIFVTMQKNNNRYGVHLLYFFVKEINTALGVLNDFDD